MSRPTGDGPSPAKQQLPSFSTHSLSNLRIRNLTLRTKIQYSEEKEHEFEPYELKLSPFFKCTKCQYKTSDRRKFRNHLYECHGSDKSFSCCYCRQSPNPRVAEHRFRSCNELIGHLLLEHMFLRFQCNICPYRACSSDHVMLHHMSRHPDNFDVAMKEMNPGYTTTVIAKPPSRILFTMAAAVGPVPGPQYYFNYFKNRRDFSSKGELKCLYCEYKKGRKDKTHVYLHVTQDHPDFPLLLYDSEIPDEPVQFDSTEITAALRDIQNRREEKMKDSTEITAALRDIQNRREERMKERAKDKTHASPAMPSTPETPVDLFRSPQLLDPRLNRHRRDSTSSFVSTASTNSSPQILEQDIPPPPVDVCEVSESLRDLTPPSNGRSSTIGPDSIKHPHSNAVTFPSLPSTSTAVKPTRKKSVEEDDGFAEPIRKRNPGYRPEKDNFNPGYRPERDNRGPGNRPEKDNRDPGYRPERNNRDPGYRPERDNRDPGYRPERNNRNPGYRPEKDNQVYEAEAVTKSKMLKCLMVKDGATCGETFLESKKEVHLKTVHEITSGFGCHCGGDQWWYGTKGNVKHHIKLQHNNSGTIYTCIVPENQDKPTLLEKINPRADPFNVPDHSKLEKPISDSKKKGSLAKKIEECQYLGPLRNEKSNKPMPGQRPSTIRTVSKKPNKQEKKWRVDERIDEKRVIKNVLHSINNSSTTSVIFCLFCERTFDVKEDAIGCMKHHLEYGLHCDHCGSYVRDDRDAIQHYKAHHSDCDGVAFVKDDERYNPGIQHWICDFFNYQTAIFNKTFKEKSQNKPANHNVYVECPLCVKALTALNTDGVTVIKYYDFVDFERHFNQHSKYSKYQCTQCTLRVKESKFVDHLKKHKITDTKNPNKYFNVKRETVDKLLEQIIDGKRREFEEKRRKYAEEKVHESSSSSDDDGDPKATKPTEPKVTKQKEPKVTESKEPKATKPIESTSKKDEEKKKPIAFNPPPPKPVELDEDIVFEDDDIVFEDDDIVFEDDDHAPEPKKRCTARKKAGPKTTLMNPKAGSSGGSESDDDIQVVWYSTGDVFVALQRDKQLDRRALLESEKGNSTVKSFIIPEVEPATDAEQTVDEKTVAEQTVASSSVSIQDATNVREISPADVEAFQKTLNERLPLGCKYCCKPEARFLKRVDIKSHISQCHPNQAIKFLTWIGES